MLEIAVGNTLVRLINDIPYDIESGKVSMVKQMMPPT